MKELCYRCGGSGKYLGNGMMLTECMLCDGDGKINKIELPAIDKIDKRSKSYRKAIEDLQALHPKMSKDEVEDLFEETYDNI